MSVLPKKIALLRVVFAAALTLVAGSSVYAADASIERIEPPNWWVGMKSDKLQLMVHGKDIADYQPELHYPGVRLDAVTTVANHNYLFLDLTIKPEAQAGQFDIAFKHGGDVLKTTYTLQARVPGSASRRGFDNADVILNLMPDRFANGDPGNDDVPGYADKSNRASDEAGRHGGDIKGIEDHLDYIAAMGYTAIWPTPLTDSNQKEYSYHGYAATDTYKIDPRYGSNEQYRRFVAKARQMGIGVIQDVVLNHIGSEHWWMRDMPAPDWISNDGKFTPTEHMHAVVSDPYSSQVDKDNFTGGWFTENMPDMNQRNSLVATYQIQNSIWWIEYAGLYGVRVDTYGYSDTTFLANWSKRVTDEYPHLNIVGEEWSSNPAIVSYWQRGKVHANAYVSSLPSLMDFPMNETLRSALVEPEAMGSGFNNLYAAQANDNLYPDPSNLVLFEGNHDENRLFSVMHQDLALYKMALAYVLTMPRIPQLYYGTEVLMTSDDKGRNDGVARRDFPGGWAGDNVNAFTGVGLTAEQKEAQSYLKTLLNWRKGQAVIHHGKLMHFTPDRGTYTYFRYDDQHIVMIVLNKNQADVPLDTARFREVLPVSAQAVDVISGKSFDLGHSLIAPARSVLILEVKK